MVAGLLVGLWSTGVSLAADSWGVTGEQEARFEARVVDIACELSGDCPRDCGAGRRQLGLLNTEQELVLPVKNATPFSGAADELAEFCGKQVIVDGLFTEHRGLRLFAVQFVREAPDGEWRAANRFTDIWADRNGIDPASGKQNQWFRHDPEVQRRLAQDGYLGLGLDTDAEFFAKEGG